MRVEGDAGLFSDQDCTTAFLDKPAAASMRRQLEKNDAPLLDLDDPVCNALEQSGGKSPQSTSARLVATVVHSPKLRICGEPSPFAANGAGGEKTFIVEIARIQLNGLAAKLGSVSAGE